MLQQPLLLAALPNAVVDMTTDFAPLFMGMVIGLFLCVLALACAIGVHDSWWTQRSVAQPDNCAKSGPEFSDAA
jgi:hypothetical protein